MRSADVDPCEAGAARRRTTLVRQRWFAAGAITAAGVAVFMIAIGDGVSTAGLSGPASLLPRWGHAAVWALLATSFAIAAARKRWSWVSGVFALLAGMIYVALLAVLLIS